MLKDYLNVNAILELFTDASLNCKSQKGSFRRISELVVRYKKIKSIATFSEIKVICELLARHNSTAHCLCRTNNYHMHFSRRTGNI